MTDNDIKKALECCISENGNDCEECPCQNIAYKQGNGGCCNQLSRYALDLINRQQAEIEKLKAKVKKLKNIERFADKLIKKQEAEIERLKAEIEEVNEADRETELQALKESKENAKLFCEAINHAKSEAIEEFAEKIDQLFYRYEHLHSHADMARKDYIKADDGTEIEMQSVWDVFTLKKYGIAEYEEMNRLQTNIELIEKGRLLAELQKDFKLLVKEMTESPTKIEHSSLCETETYKE